MKRLFLAILISPIIGITVISTSTPQNSIPQHVAISHLNATFGEKEESTQEEEKPSLLFGIIKQPDLTKNEITDREAQEIAFNLTIGDEQKQSNNSTPSVIDITFSVIDITFIDKMELVAGDGRQKQEHLFEKVFGSHINTAMGKAHGTINLCSPSTNIDIIHRRQKAIRALLENEYLLDQLSTILQNIKSDERQLLMFWHNKPPFKQETLKLLYFGPWLKRFNTNTPVMETVNKLGTIMLTILGPSLMPAMIIRAIAQEENCSLLEASKKLIDMCKLIVTNPDLNWKHKTMFALVPACEVFSAYFNMLYLKNKTKICNHLQSVLIGAASYVRNLEHLGHIINEHKELFDCIPSFAHLTQLTNNEIHSRKFLKLVGMLETNTFKGEPSFFSITGRVLAAYALMNEIKDEFIPALTAAGELDTYVALAKQYNVCKEKQTQYSFVEFIENDRPLIEAQEFWNPLTDADKIITNNSTLGIINPNIILTGPNTGGKSIAIKGLLINLLLAQTYGIVPAQKLVITPFTKLNCHLNIKDDNAAGISKFKAEVLGAKQLITTLKDLPNNMFSFTIMDELFTSTNQQDGEKAACLFAKKLSEFDNSITIIATHYQKMIDLEADTHGAYKNYHVEVIREDDGTINRTFRLLPGPSYLNIAIDILKEEAVL